MPKVDQYMHTELTHAIIGCAMDVHSTLGCGFQEVIYQRALAVEMERKNIPFVRESDREIFYKGVNVGTRRADFFVADCVLVEIKALTAMENVHLAQAINYLEAYAMNIGLLLNFGAKRLEFRRLIQSNLKGVRE
jgi:GxxExxY protein